MKSKKAKVTPRKKPAAKVNLPEEFSALTPQADVNSDFCLLDAAAYRFSFYFFVIYCALFLLHPFAVKP